MHLELLQSDAESAAPVAQADAGRGMAASRAGGDDPHATGTGYLPGTVRQTGRAPQAVGAFVFHNPRPVHDQGAHEH